MKQVLNRELTKLGINNMVVNPADIPTTDKDRKQKEDARDSRKIAEQLAAYTKYRDLKATHDIYYHDIQTRYSCWSRRFITWLKI